MQGPPPEKSSLSSFGQCHQFIPASTLLVDTGTRV